MPQHRSGNKFFTGGVPGPIIVVGSLFGLFGLKDDTIIIMVFKQPNLGEGSVGVGLGEGSGVGLGGGGGAGGIIMLISPPPHFTLPPTPPLAQAAVEVDSTVKKSKSNQDNFFFCIFFSLMDVKLSPWGDWEDDLGRSSRIGPYR